MKIEIDGSLTPEMCKARREKLQEENIPSRFFASKDNKTKSVYRIRHGVFTKIIFFLDSGGYMIMQVPNFHSISGEPPLEITEQQFNTILNKALNQLK